MTLYKLIEGVYQQFENISSFKVRELLIFTLNKDINYYWPLIKNENGIKLDIVSDTQINISIDDKLYQEFYKKYPEALI